MPFPAERPTLKTRRLVLRPTRAEDAGDIARLAGDREVARMTARLPHPYPLELAHGWLAILGPAWAEHRELVLAVTLAADGGFIGTIGLLFATPPTEAEMGFWIGRPYWGQGYATEAAAALLGYGFGPLVLERVVARHFASNVASGRVLAKAGLRRVGVQPEGLNRDGVHHDLVLHSLARTDWPHRPA